MLLYSIKVCLSADIQSLFHSKYWNCFERKRFVIWTTDTINDYWNGFHFTHGVKSIFHNNDFITVFGEFIREQLEQEKELKNYKQEVYDYLTLNLQLAADEIEEIYEQLDFGDKDETVSKEFSDLFTNEKKIEQIVRQLEDTCKGDWDIMSMIA